MSFCHECGEQVAKEDVFCPYCGISIQPVAPVEDISMSATIVAFLPPIVVAEAETPDESSSVDLPLPSLPISPEVASVPEAPDVSRDGVLPAWPGDEIESQPDAVSETRESEPEAGPVAAEPEAATRAQSVPEAAEQSEPEVIVAVEPGGYEPSDSAVLEQLFAAEDAALPSDSPAPADAQILATAEADPLKAETVEVDSVSEVTEISGELSPDSDDPSAGSNVGPAAEASTFDEATVETAPVEIAPVEIAPIESAPVEITPIESAPVEAVQTQAAAVSPESESTPVETPIAMPENILLLEDEPAPKFDSVQIIEKKAAELSGEKKAARSFTTPNIGGTDTDGRKSAKLQPLEEGTVLNSRYEVVRKIGGGGMGAVYLANDRNLGGVLRAVKEMVQSYIESEQQDKAVNDFKRESLLLTSLDHPAIPTIYDYFFDEKEGRFYLVMRYISGGDLAGRLRAAPEGKIDEKSVTEWSIQIADVLEYLHRHEPPIVYRDLKPANVMIDGNSGRVMLIDFGIARWVNKEEKGVTAVGTMGYAPPELFSGNVEARSDIYSLGSTMFHLLTGADPQSNPLLIFDFQKNPRPRQISSTLSDQIEQILMRAVEYNADLRFKSAAEMRDALKDHLANLVANRVTFGVKAAPANRTFSEQPVFCGFCGKQIVATDVFCAFCGAQQPLAQQGGTSAPVAVQAPVAKLTIMATGDLEPSIFRIEKNENLLGRRDPMSNIFPEVDLSKYDPQTKISRRHARVWRDGHGFLVEDLGSSNGTTLIQASGEPIRLLPHQPHTLTSGDRVKLGDTLLQFTVG